MLNCIQMLDSPPCLIGWETHDEGDMDTNADTSSWSGTGQITWVSTEEAARLANNNATDFTPETFDDIYEKVWNDRALLFNNPQVLKERAPIVKVKRRRN